jgi:DNA-directed RNA polymerase subunit M/transcription elongation factor TFIIS
MSPRISKNRKMTTYREQGKAALSTVLNKAQNINIIEKYVYIVSSHEVEEDDISGIYKRNLYQTIGDILNGEKLEKMLSEIKDGKLGWNHPAFKDIQIRMEEQDSFIETPFEVVEGVLECRCGSKRVIYYQRQHRSCDEPMTTYASCCACSKKWTYSG